jgi:hypothetical protein
MTLPRKLAFGALFAVLRCAAQTPAELMQKAIYEQETAGNSDGALLLYRQITTNAPPQSAIAAQAQFRIAELLLQKGDLPGAATEFSVLASRYSEQQSLIAKMAGRINGIQNQPTGVVRDGRYKESRTGLEFVVPAGWKTTYNSPTASDNGDMVGFADGSSVDYCVWSRPENLHPGDIPKLLSGVVAFKAKANVGFDFKPENIQNRTAAGQQAVSAIANYSENGKNVASYYVWVYTTKAHVMFAARGVPAADLALAQSKLEQLIATAIVP